MKSKILKWMSVFMIILVATLPLALAAQTSFVYDANGNVVYDGETYREYNSLNQLWKVFNGTDNITLITSYEYHPTEERVHVKRNYNSSGYLLETIIYVSDTFVMKVNDTGTYEEVYVHLNGELVGQEINNKKEFVSGDHLSSSSVLTNSTGSVIESSTYDPHGLVLTGASETRFDYESRENEPFGTMDFRFRHYNPEYAIFYQPDTYVQSAYLPQTLNHYLFENGNPFRYVDPSGHISIGWKNFLQNDVERIKYGGEYVIDISKISWKKSNADEVYAVITVFAPIDVVISSFDFLLAGTNVALFGETDLYNNEDVLEKGRKASEDLAWFALGKYLKNLKRSASGETKNVADYLYSVYEFIDYERKAQQILDYDENGQAKRSDGSNQYITYESYDESGRRSRTIESDVCTVRWC